MNTEQHLIPSGSSLKQAMEKMNSLSEMLTLFVVDNRKLIGTLTDGDIRRALLSGTSLDESVDKAMFTNFRYIKKGSYDHNTLKVFRDEKISLIPYLDQNHKIIRLIDVNAVQTVLPVDVVIMAGGKGQRLKPLTDNIPKPLLHIAGKPIIDYTIQRLKKFGIDSIHITVNYLKEQIIEYLRNDSDISFNFVEETNAMGTIGSVGSIKDFQNDNVLVINSDLLTNIDFEDFYNTHISEDAAMTVASVPYHIDLPYAILEVNDKNIHSFREKPTYTYYSNAGMYFIKRKFLNLIPQNSVFNATDFMQEMINRKNKLIYYPMYCYWLDIGRHEDFRKAVADVEHIKF